MRDKGGFCGAERSLEFDDRPGRPPCVSGRASAYADNLTTSMAKSISQTTAPGHPSKHDIRKRTESNPCPAGKRAGNSILSFLEFKPRRLNDDNPGVVDGLGLYRDVPLDALRK